MSARAPRTSAALEAAYAAMDVAAPAVIARLRKRDEALGIKFERCDFRWTGKIDDGRRLGDGRARFVEGDR